MNQPREIFNEYNAGREFKLSLGNKGLYDQTDINERFYIGDQWYGAKCGNDRPLVRYNVIKRIGDYKISQLLNSPVDISFSAEGVPVYTGDLTGSKAATAYSGSYPDSDEINSVMRLLGNYHRKTADRIKLNEIYEKVLRNAYIGGGSVVYTYWNPSVVTGQYAQGSNKVRIEGDICSEVLDIRDITFADPYCGELQNQPYIIISGLYNTEAVLREARLYGADISALREIEECGSKGKIKVLTKLYKEYENDGRVSVMATKVCEKGVIRAPFNTRLKLYPLALFNWERKTNSVYGESEVTYLIPNQIAINRMITANVWSAMTSGMPIMLVNGDTVDEKITNEPGQILKIYGTNEDVAGAVKYVSPPAYFKEFDSTVNTLIENTLTQCGANEVALGDSKAENATALAAMRDAALLPLQIVKNRFYTFAEDLARVWVDFWVNYYGKRGLKTETERGVEYVMFNSNRYKDLVIGATVDVSNATIYSEREKIEMLLSLFEKGIINRNQLLKRLPRGSVSDVASLISEQEEAFKNDSL